MMQTCDTVRNVRYTNEQNDMLIQWDRIYFNPPSFENSFEKYQIQWTKDNGSVEIIGEITDLATFAWRWSDDTDYDLNSVYTL